MKETYLSANIETAYIKAWYDEAAKRLLCDKYILAWIIIISSAAILALKELSESTDNRERYVMLRKLGADEKMLNKALFKQIGLFFGFPLFIAIIHSIVGIKFCNTILLSIGRTGLLPSIIMTGAFLVVIYGGYFVITYWCSKNIIK